MYCLIKPLFIGYVIALIVTSSIHAQELNSNQAGGLQAIERFVQAPDSSFGWKHTRTKRLAPGNIHELRVTSQTWQTIQWQHAVEIYEPKQLAHPNHALLFVTGGSRPSEPTEEEIKQGFSLAIQCGAPVIMLHQVPNQPLLDGRKEDDLISETWLRYLETGDETWPLLFPMVKSAVRTIDAVQAFSKQELEHEIKKIVITGASKRGWTSWLTPVVDQRIVGTAPIVIDMLNFRKQMNHQLATWGDFSIQIRDYTSKGLVKRPQDPESAREQKLRTMMDPYSYVEKLILPKLLIVGTNDPYWTVDAMNLYWGDLSGPKFVSQHANAGHGLEGSQEEAMRTLAGFFRLVATGQRLPSIQWEPKKTESTIGISIETDDRAKSAKLWFATSQDGDFRDDKWNSKPATKTANGWQSQIDTQTGKQQAIFGEVEFEEQGGSWSFTTLVYRFENND